MTTHQGVAYQTDNDEQLVETNTFEDELPYIEPCEDQSSCNGNEDSFYDNECSVSISVRID